MTRSVVETLRTRGDARATKWDLHRLFLFGCASICFLGCATDDQPISVNFGGNGSHDPADSMNCVPVTYCDPGYDDPEDENDFVGGVKDFTLIEAEGLFHLFHIADPKNAWNSPPDLGERNFGHATTSNLVKWETKPRIELRNRRAGGWSRSHIWAPHVIRSGAIYTMFYTGVAWSDSIHPSKNVQQIGLATSSNLISWDNHPKPDPDRVGWLLAGPDPSRNDWCAWGRGLDWGDDCRDPFVFDDGDKYVMFVTLKTYSEPYEAHGPQVVATATNRNRDLVTWEWDVENPAPSHAEYPGYPGYIEATRPLLAESPHLIKVDATYYLFWTALGDDVRVASADCVYGPYAPISIYGLSGSASEALQVNANLTLYGSIEGEYILGLHKLVFEVGEVPEVRATAYRSCD